MRSDVAESGIGDAVFWLVVLALAVLFVGEPDLHDVILRRLGR